jgi:ATP-dependent DNA helicase 2 subunit 2
VLDVGENTVVASGKGGTSFFDRAKLCVSKIIQKKIFSNPGDEVAVLLFGSDETKNDLNTSLSGYENIVEAIPLQAPSWDMVRSLDNLSPSDYSSSEWVDGLIVALNFAKNETQ